MDNPTPRRAAPESVEPTTEPGAASAAKGASAASGSSAGGASGTGGSSGGATAASTGAGGNRRAWVILAAVLAALLLAGLVYSLVRALHHDDDKSNTAATSPSSSAGASSSPGSSGSCSSVSVIDADPVWAPALQSAASTWAASTGSCSSVQVVSTPEATVQKNGLGTAKAWAPQDASSTSGNAQFAQAVPTVVGSSPLLVVAQKQVQDALGKTTLSGQTLAQLASGQKNWTDFGRNWGPLRLVLPNPATNAAGAVGFQTIAATVAGNGTATNDLTVIQRHIPQMAQVQYHVVQTVDDPTQVLQHLAPVASDDTGRGAAGPRVGVVPESVLLAAKPAAGTLTATPLAGGASGLQLALVNPGNDQQVQNFTSWLRGADGQKALASSGVTTTSQAPDASARASVGLPATMPTAVMANPAVQQAKQLYASFSQRISTTSVLDASGSMGQPLAGSKLRKIDLVTQAATSSWSQWPNGSASALFTFNADDSGKPNIRLVVPWIVAGAPGSAQQMTAYGSHLGAIPVNGGTPLYDAIYTGYQYALQHYTPGNRNQVLVVTDGADQDAKEKLNLATLIQKLKAGDPKKPISMRFIAIGPDADFTSLQQLAAATGGKAEWATTPANLPGVVQDVMS